jgi:sporulation protein YlmC with PRC-barrel domain
MVDVPMGAKVQCADGATGRCTGVIIEPTTWQVTHFVVKENRVPFTEHLVSVDQVTETTPDLVRLRCNKSKLAAMQPFVETEYQQWNRSEFVGALYSGWYGWPYVVLATMVTPVKHERIPPGELAVRRGARVKATDGQVGRVDEFMIDATTRHITHLVLREGPLWDQKDVMIPVSAIERAGEDVVCLKLDRHTIELLPAVPARQWHNRKAA